MLRFTMFGFPVAIHWMFWVVGFGFGGGLTERASSLIYQQAFLFMAAALVSILWHELGHALLMRAFGSRATILLHGFGGQTAPDPVNGARWTRGQDIVISLAGPFFSVVLGVACYALASMSRNDSWHVQVLMGFMIFINLFWSLINLLPVLPLDGGHVLAALLYRNPRTVAIIGGVTAALAAVFLWTRFHQLFNSIFFALLALQNFQRLQKNSGAYPPGLGP